MASEIAGLFMTPEQYGLLQQQQGQQEALRYAELDPFQRAAYGMFKGGRQLAGGIANLMGVQDPQLRMIAQRQQLSKSIDPSDPTSLFSAAQRAAEMGDQQFALTLADYGRKAQVDIATAQQKMREKTGIDKEIQVAQARAGLQDTISQLEAQPSSPDRDRALAIAKNTLAGLPIPGKTAASDKDIAIAERRAAAQGLQPNTNAYNKFIDEELLRLTSKEKPEKANIKEVGVAAGTNKAVFLDVNNDQLYTYQTGADGKQVRVPYDGAVDRTTAKVSASASSQQESEFRKGMGRLQAKRYDEATALRDNSIAALNSLQKLTQLDQSGLISGAYATNRVGLSNFLDTIGLLGVSDKQKLSSSENYQKVAGDIVLATLGGRLGAGFSNEDRKFIQGLVPQLETSPLARKQLLDFLVRKNQSIVDETTRMMDYAETKGTLSGFVPKIPLVNIPSPGTTGAMTDEQLLDALKKAKPKAKGQ